MGLMTPEQIADRLLVQRRTVYNWLKEGTLPGVKGGRLWRVRPADLEWFLRDHPDEQPTEKKEGAPDESDLDLRQSIITRCLRKKEPGRARWDEWQLLRDPQLCTRTFKTLAHLIDDAVKREDGRGDPPWLVCGNPQGGAFSCLTQAHGPWPVTFPYHSPNGMDLLPDPRCGHEAPVLRFVIVDTNVRTGGNIQHSYDVIRTVLEKGSTPRFAKVLCIAVIFNSHPTLSSLTLDDHNPSVPILALVDRADLSSYDIRDIEVRDTSVSATTDVTV
jgi:excisionase family DNA binding protein